MDDYFNSDKVRKDENARTLSYFCTEDVVTISKDIIKGLVEEYRKGGEVDVRISLHKTPEDSFHNMIILQRKGAYYRPHKHAQKVEVYQMVEGEMAVFIFDDNGDVEVLKILSPDKNFIFRIPANKHHVTVPISDYVIFHESKPGPFLGKGDSIFAPWTPERYDIEGGKKYFDKLMRMVK